MSEKTTRSHWLYLFIVPGIILGWVAGGIVAPLAIGLFSEEMLRINDAALWLPPILFFPLGIMGMTVGGGVGFLWAWMEINDAW